MRGVTGFLLIACAGAFTTALEGACRSTDPIQPAISGDTSSIGCGAVASIVPDRIPACLSGQRVLSTSDRDSAYRIIVGAEAVRDLYLSDTGIKNFNKASEITRSLAHLQDYYARGLFEDSARFHRMLDHVLVTLAYVENTGVTVDRGGHLWPSATPYLAWVYYSSAGVHFQPVTTAQYVVSVIPKTTIPTDSVVAIANHLFSYELWRESGGVRFPVWEYQFTWTSGGITDQAPWVSGMAQGLALEVFAQAYLQTHDSLWLRRGYDVTKSFGVDWDHGGIMVPDTSHGYWWEEFNPVVRVWNGSVQALVAVGVFAQVTGDSTVWKLFHRGLDALKYYTPRYDTGTWTLYSLTQGYNSVTYHLYEVALLDKLFTLSGDQWCKATADRWRTYSPPPGVK